MLSVPLAHRFLCGRLFMSLKLGGLNWAGSRSRERREGRSGGSGGGGVEAEVEDKDSVMLNFMVNLTVSVPDTWSNSVLGVSVRVCPGVSPI